MLRQPNGINISEYVSGEVDFRALRSTGISFMYHTASIGARGIDQKYTERRETASLYRIAFGALHQARPTRKLKSAYTQANHFVACANFEPGDLIPAVAVYETQGLSKRALERWLKRFSSRVQTLTGHYPMILTPVAFSPSVRGLRWVPQHARDVPPPEGCGTSLWQHSANVSGIDGIVCVSNFVGKTNLQNISTRANISAADVIDTNELKELFRVQDPIRIYV